MTSQLPLYILAQNHELPEYQFMDSLTLKWIESNKPNFEDVSIIKIEPSTIIDKYIKRYSPKIEWFQNESLISTMHGQRHILRCIALVGILFETKQLSVGIDELCILSALHDIRRKNDKDDSDHAERAALWVKENIKIIFDNYGYMADELSLEKITTAILYHDKVEYPKTPDLSLIELIDNFKMIDALDRYRQPKIKWWLSDDYLKIKPKSVIKKIAFDLVVKSEGYFLLGFNNEQSVHKAIYDIL
ncbi:MAG: hypothetical protein ABIJ40_02475 [Bacteroidota bacterium]